jgi:hypothetical protein
MAWGRLVSVLGGFATVVNRMGVCYSLSVVLLMSTSGVYVVDTRLLDKLVFIFQNVNEWLKFAEAKNAALLAFSGAGMTATLTVLATGQNVPKSIQVGLLLSTISLGVCTLTCAMSFLPKTDLEKLLWVRNRSSGRPTPQPSTDNLYFYGDLRKYNDATLLDELNRSYFNSALSNYYVKEYSDLVNQILINSDIAFSKLTFFRRGVYALIVAVLTVPVAVVLSLLFYQTV